jgi:hypothetical protein
MKKTLERFKKLGIEEEILYIKPGSGWYYGSIGGLCFDQRMGEGYALRKVNGGMEIREFDRGAESEQFRFVPEHLILSEIQNIAREFLGTELLKSIKDLKY